MNTGFGQRRIDTVQQEPRNFQDLPPRKPVTRPEPQKLQPAPRNFRVSRPEPQKFQPPPPPPPPAKTTPPPAPVFAERRQEPIDRQSSDYGHTYDYVDYSNYDYVEVGNLNFRGSNNNERYKRRRYKPKNKIYFSRRKLRNIS